MDKQFSPDFYITCATVIPVLFLAVTVQGPAWGWVLGVSERAGRYSNPILRKLFRLESAGQGARNTLAELMTVPLVVILLVSVTACGLGEGLALYVLYRGQSSMDDRRDVLVATLFLVAAVLAGPLLVGARGLWLLAKSPWLLVAQVLRDPSDQARGAEAQNTDRSETAEGPAPGRAADDHKP